MKCRRTLCTYGLVRPIRANQRRALVLCIYAVLLLCAVISMCLEPLAFCGSGLMRFCCCVVLAFCDARGDVLWTYVFVLFCSSALLLFCCSAVLRIWSYEFILVRDQVRRGDR